MRVLKFVLAAGAAAQSFQSYGAGTACRTDAGTGVEGSTFTLIQPLAQACASCRTRCANEPSCQAYECNSNTDRCELWRELPVRTAALADFECVRKVGSRSPPLDLLVWAGQRAFATVDGVMGGRSTGTVTSANGGLLFQGYLETRGGGFAYIRMTGGSGNQLDLTPFAGLELVVEPIQTSMSSPSTAPVAFEIELSSGGLCSSVSSVTLHHACCDCYVIVQTCSIVTRSCRFASR